MSHTSPKILEEKEVSIYCGPSAKQEAHCEDGIFCLSEVSREMGDSCVIMCLYNVKCEGRTPLLTLGLSGQ